jgi:hypothetical protein
MPGNEYGERIHNFFGQEGLSQDSHQPQAGDGSWSGFRNGLVSNQRQIDPSLIANLKTYSTQQSGMHFVSFVTGASPTYALHISFMFHS